MKSVRHRTIAINLPALLLSASLCSPGFGQEVMRCEVESDQGATRIVVKLDVPHADKMLLITPDGRRIYLRDSDTPTQHPDTNDFTSMGMFVLDKKTRGTWFNDWGETEVVAAIGTAGKYELLVADDLEKESGASSSARCTFML